jgi:hypothetical protein
VSAAVWLAVRQEVDELLDETLQASAEVLGRLLSRRRCRAAAGGGRDRPAPAARTLRLAAGRPGRPGAAALGTCARQPWLPLPT